MSTVFSPAREPHVASLAADPSPASVPVAHRCPLHGLPLLVERPCPPPQAPRAAPPEFEVRVLETAVHARFVGIPAYRLRASARLHALAAVVSLLLAAVMTAIAPRSMLGLIPIALAAGFGWQWAVLTAGAQRLEREPGPG